MKKNKIISLVLAAFSVFSLSSLCASAYSSDQGGEPLSDGTFSYELRDGSYTIIGCNMDSIIEEIPELRNGYAITAIDERAFASCTNIKTLTIPDTIVSIGDSAFAGCSDLKEIRLPEKITTISSGMFMGCESLESIDIPDTVNRIESYAFYKCSMLKEVELPGALASIDPMAFAECSSIENFDTGNSDAFVYEEGFLMNRDKTNIFRASAKLEGDVYIPDGITAIEAGVTLKVRPVLYSPALKLYKKFIIIIIF